MDPAPGPTPDPVDPTPVDPTPVDPKPVDHVDPPSGNPLQELLDMIQAIKDRPHYSSDENSRTTWQVDETMDYLEEQLWNIEQAFKTAGLMQ